jgi:hypothetical protein
MTGGEYGPEGGMLAMAVILVAIVYLSFSKSIYTSEEMRVLVLALVTSRSPEAPITIFSAPPEEEVRKG